MAAKSEEAIARARARAKAWARAHPDSVAAYGKQYREANRAKLDAWREANRERIARERKTRREADPESAHDAERRARERARARDVRRLQHNAYTRRMRAENPEAARARSRRFREEHPEKVREYQRRYRERHPERARHNQAMAAQRHRDANAEAIRERQRAAAVERRRERPDAYREWYERNLEEQRARGREASRLRSRLKKAGLPPRNIHRVFAAARRGNDAAADTHFRRPRTVEELAVIATELEQVSAVHLPQAVRTLRRELLDGALPPGVYLQRSTENAEPVPGTPRFGSKQYVAALKQLRERELHRLRQDHEQRVENILAARPQIYQQHLYRRRAVLRDEIQMDSIARVARGLPPYDLDEELRVRVDREVTPIVHDRLADTKETTLQRIDEIVRRYRVSDDVAAPYQPPASQPSSAFGLS
ncbi:hypothetical protein MZK47_06915 [Microbacterium aerolatum]|uniref:hypothetical protein n=1 Tax=Microbacterium aerolatum TaxID=153731 RepID=UPI002000BB6C|nr:hypothetical protein [Microbacterium aerolatum]MCK3769394.1 hypothetical protein [Microbacterium aerolatum]